MAPQLKPIDWAKFELYLKAGATQTKIAKSFGIDPETLSYRVKDHYGMSYTDYSTSLHSTGELLIEATQFQKALAGNIQMLLWLGKIRCGQREPEMVSSIPPQQEYIDKDHVIMQLQHQITTLTEKFEQNADKSQTE